MNVQEVLELLPEAEHPEILEKYKEFITDRYYEKLSEGYVEKHHILPVAFGFDRSFKDQKWNKIALLAKDHFIAHELLWKAYGKKMAAPYFQMSVTRGFSISAEDYSLLREEYSLQRREAMRGKKRAPFTAEHRTRLATAARNRPKRTCSKETKAKMKLAWKERKLKGFVISQEQRDKISKAHLGKKVSEDTKKKISESSSGENHWSFGKSVEEMPMFGKKHSENTKRKISEAQKGIKKGAHLKPCPLCGKLCQAGGSLKSHLIKCQAEVGASQISDRV